MVGGSTRRLTLLKQKCSLSHFSKISWGENTHIYSKDKAFVAFFFFLQHLSQNMQCRLNKPSVDDCTEHFHRSLHFSAYCNTEQKKSFQRHLIISPNCKANGIHDMC